MTRVFAARVGEKPERNYFVIQSEKVDSPLYNQKSFFFTIKILSLNIWWRWNKHKWLFLFGRKLSLNSSNNIYQRKLHVGADNLYPTFKCEVYFFPTSFWWCLTSWTFGLSQFCAKTARVNIALDSLVSQERCFLHPHHRTTRLQKLRMSLLTRFSGIIY